MLDLVSKNWKIGQVLAGDWTHLSVVRTSTIVAVGKQGHNGQYRYNTIEAFPSVCKHIKRSNEF